jgi:hypothetical protein
MRGAILGQSVPDRGDGFRAWTANGGLSAVSIDVCHVRVHNPVREQCSTPDLPGPAGEHASVLRPDRVLQTLAPLRSPLPILEHGSGMDGAPAAAAAETRRAATRPASRLMALSVRRAGRAPSKDLRSCARCAREVAIMSSLSRFPVLVLAFLHVALLGAVGPAPRAAGDVPYVRADRPHPDAQPGASTGEWSMRAGAERPYPLSAPLVTRIPPAALPAGPRIAAAADGFHSLAIGRCQGRCRVG